MLKKERENKMKLKKNQLIMIVTYQNESFAIIDGHKHNLTLKYPHKLNIV
jgi:hypothetical protein